MSSAAARSVAASPAPAAAAQQAEQRRLRKDLEAAWAELQYQLVCADPVYFFEEFVWVESKRDPRGMERLELFDYQRDALRDYLTNRWVIVLKSRQQGFTVMTMAYLLWLMVKIPGAKILVVSKTEDDAKENIRKLRFMYDRLPDWLKARLDANDNSQLFSLAHPNGFVSQVKSVPATGSAGAGFTADAVFLDEFALESKGLADQIYGTIKSSLDAKASSDWPHALMIVASTARGANNTYARLYRAAKRGENAFHPIFVPWQKSPFVTPEIYDEKKREFESLGTPWKLFSEYPASDEEAFRESGTQRFRTLPTLDELAEPPLRGWPKLQDGRFMLDAADAAALHLTRLDPDPDCFYVVALDPAAGHGGDFIAAQLLEVDPAEATVDLVGYYHVNEREIAAATRDLIVVGRHFAGRYQPAATFIVETTGGYGATPLHVLREDQYPAIYRELDLSKPAARRKTTWGKHTNPKSKPEMINNLAGVLDGTGDWRLTGMYPLLRYELGTFVVKPNGQVEGDVGCNDDLVMALALGMWAVKTDAPSSPRRARNADVVKAPQQDGAFILLDRNRLKPRSQQTTYRRKPLRSGRSR